MEEKNQDVKNVFKMLKVTQLGARLPLIPSSLDLELRSEPSPYTPH